MLEVVWRPVVMLRITNGRRRAPERTIIWIYPRFLRTEAKNQTDGQTCDWSKKKKKKSGDASWCDVCFRWADGSCSLEVKHFLRTVLFPPHLKSEQSEGPWRVWPKYHHPSSPLRAHTHTHRLPLNYAKRPFNKYGPHNTKDSRYSDISPTFLVFFLSSSLDVSKTPR